ncbi:MAG: lysophospholipid acyltransferase family protein [Pseudomonadota bacterium]
MKLLQYIFSAAVWTLSFAWMSILAIATLIFSAIFSYRRVHSWIPAPGFALIPRMTLSRLNITYDPKLDRKRLSVFCFNHTNLLDAHVTSASIPHAFCGLMNAWQFKIPFYGWLMRMSKGIPVHRRSGTSIQEQITREAKKRKEIGFSILVFPEAHRTRDGRVHTFHKGVFLMARDAGYPVVPCAIRGSYAVNRKGSFLFAPGKIDVWIGPQYETTGLSDPEIGALAREFQQIITEYVEYEEKEKAA